MQSSINPHLKPEHRFRIYAIDERPAVWPQMNPTVTTSEMVWEEPPGWEVTVDFRTRNAAATEIAEEMADESGERVMLCLWPMIGPQLPEVGSATYISPNPHRRAANTYPDYDPSDYSQVTR